MSKTFSMTISDELNEWLEKRAALNKRSRIKELLMILETEKDKDKDNVDK